MATGAVRDRLAIALAGMLLAAAVVPESRVPSAQAPGGLLAVDFYALTSDGRPIADLRAEEVSIKVNGRTRPVRALQFVELASLPTGGTAAGTTPPLPQPFGSNANSGHGRAFIIVIDDESIRPGKERPLRAAVAQMLGSLSARDRVAVVTVPHGGMKLDLTTDHDNVAKAVSAVSGQAPQGESGQDGACRTRNNLESLEGLLYSLGGGEGPTTVLFFSTAMLGPRRDSVVTRAPGMCELTPQHFVKVGTAAAAARAHFYVIQPDDVMVRPGAILNETIAGVGFTGSENPLEGLENLAGVTGGHRLSIPATGDATLVRVVRETSGYYLASFDPEGSERDGASHGLDVRVSRSGVVVRARPEIIMARVSPAPVRAAPMTPYEMLRSGRVIRDLPLRTAGFASRHTADDKLKVVFVAEAADPAVKLTGAAAGLFDSQDRLTAIWNALESDLGASTLLAALAVPPGTYRLRVAASDASGRSGTADADVVAELATAGPLKLSSVVLGLSRNNTFVPRLQFSTEPAAIAYLEFYGGTPGTRISATIEVASSVDGPALLTTPLAIEATSEDGRFLATGAVPIGALPPGDFVVRAIVGIEGQPAGRVIRILRKTK